MFSIHLRQTDVPVGAFKTFGYGPNYQVGLPIRQLENGDWLVNITLIETGEKAEYTLSKLLADPAAE